MSVRERFQSAVQTVAVTGLTTLERLQTGVAYNPLTKGYLEDPYPLYRKIQSRDPVHRSRLVSGWVLTRYADINEALTDSRFQSDDRKLPDFEKFRQKSTKAAGIPDDRPTPSMLRLDPPDHTRLRSLVNKAFTPRAIEKLRPRVEEIVDELLDAVADNGAMDVIEDLAYPLPVMVIAEMLGVPGEDRDQLKRWSDEIVLTLGAVASGDAVRRAYEAGKEMIAYIERIADERKRDPKDDLLSALLGAEEEGDRLTIEEVYSTVLLILVAGHETTTNLIGNGLLALFRNPDQLELLRDDPALAQSAVEELLRYDSPVQATSRLVTEEVALDGHTVKAFQQVVLLLGAANRDPEQFTNPDRLDITRDEGSSLSFSHGIHFCLGAPLARIEAQIALPALLQRFPNLKLATERVEWGEGIILRGLKSLPVTF
jgi:cytochrome P450